MLLVLPQKRIASLLSVTASHRLGSKLDMLCLDVRETGTIFQTFFVVLRSASTGDDCKHSEIKISEFLFFVNVRKKKQLKASI